ncbi:MFS transporter [Streptomyces sp. NPDC059092]|uniref:MFS transporter n=1 Tax=Streptomyces sp. NPDC059092 TaxID=3346725 RepID=UPI00369312A1
MRTYRELFRTQEFTPLFLLSAGHVGAQTVSGLALGTLIYSATGSPLLSALAMFGPSLAQVLGATTLLSAADRLPPRATLAGTSLLFGLGTAALAVPGPPVWASFAVLFLLGTVASPVGGVRYGLLNEILERDGYLLGRSVLNMCAGTAQIGGYALGGVLVTTLSPRGTLLAGAALHLATAVVARLGLGGRPPRATGRPSAAATWRTNALLLSSRARRAVYLALWIPNGLIVGCESLFVAYAPRYAGLLFACAACGMLAGDVTVGRLVPARWRGRLGVPLLLLLALPYPLLALRPALPLVAAAVAVASVGFAASLVLQERLMSLTPGELNGHALGLHTSGMLTMQGVGAALAGGVAQLTSVPAATAVMAALSVTVTLTLAPGLRREPAAGGDTPRPATAPRPGTPAP